MLGASRGTHMNLKSIIPLAGAFVLGAASMAFVGGAAQAANKVDPEIYRWLGDFGDALDTAMKHHLKPVDGPRAIQAAIGGMMRSLDSRSDYIGPDAFERMRGRGPYSAGVGLAMEREVRGVIVTGVTPGAAGEAAGIRPGDILYAVDGVTLEGESLQDVVDRLVGPPGSTVTLALSRDGQALSIPVARRALPRNASVSSRMEGDYGYIAVTSLDENATKETEAALTRLRAGAPAMKGLVLDLRNSPGGLLDQAVGISDIFLEAGPIMSQSGREPNDVERYNARAGDALGGLPIVVLINARTASGSEIIAGALQERGRARVVGVPSYGLATVQTVIPLRGGKSGALKLTTGQMRLPSGGSFQKHGLTPDLLVAHDAAEAEAERSVRYRPSERNLAGALDLGAPAPDRRAPEVPPKGFDSKTGDYQLSRAIDLLKGPRPAG